MRKAARWGNVLLDRIQPPKSSRPWHSKLLRNVLGPMDMLIRFLVRRMHQDQGRQEASHAPGQAGAGVTKDSFAHARSSDSDSGGAGQDSLTHAAESC